MQVSELPGAEPGRGPDSMALGSNISFLTRYEHNRGIDTLLSALLVRRWPLLGRIERGRRSRSSACCGVLLGALGSVGSGDAYRRAQAVFLDADGAYAGVTVNDSRPRRGGCPG
jgi:hypothetical protein